MKNILKNNIRAVACASHAGCVCALMLIMGNNALVGQTLSTTASIVSLNPSNVILERRPFSTAYPMTVPPPTYITVHRTNSTGAAVVLFSADYRTASGRQLSNTELQQDLGTTQLSLDNTGLASNVLFFEPGQSVGYLVFYPIRVNFQKNEDRILTVSVLPSRAGFGQAYGISTTLGTVRLTLKDNESASSQPFLLNAVQNASMTNGSVTLIELETPGTRGDGLPSRVFANENGSPLTYSTASLHPDIVRAEVVPAQSRPNNQAGLRLTAVSTGIAKIMIVAVDDKNRAATTFFDVNVQVAAQTPTSLRCLEGEAFLPIIAPNPVLSDILWLEGVPEGALCRILTPAGQEIMRWTSVGNLRTPERVAVSNLRQGAYFLFVEANGQRSARLFLRQ